MGQSSDQIREEIDAKRDDAAQKIDQLQAEAMNMTEELRDQAQGVVDDSIQTVKESLDVRQQIEQRPLLSLGVALAAGFALGSMMGGDGHQRHARHQSHQMSSGAVNVGAMDQGGGSSFTSTLTDLAHKSGLDETLSNAAAAFLGNITDQFQQTIDRNFPGFSEKMQSAERTPGGFAEKSQATQHAAANDTGAVYRAQRTTY